VNLNTATAEELTRLPGIGEALAGKIIEHRSRYGPFRRPEDVLIIDGISERRYRELAHLVCAQ
jgi:competence protein ComEA